MKNTELIGPYRFRLVRNIDKTGVSGTGHIADGCQFNDGSCVLRWRSSHTSTAVYANHESLMAIHGHDGATVCEWHDQPPTKAFRQGALDCAQDGMENAPFASIGGLEARRSPVLKYAKPGEEAEYLRGYIACARANYGDDWATCSFGWSKALAV